MAAERSPAPVTPRQAFTWLGLSILIWIALIAGVFWYLAHYIVWPAALVIAVLGGCFLLIGLATAKSGMVDGVILRRRLAPERIDHLPSRRGEAIVEGTIEAADTTLQPPVGDTPCVAFEYTIWRRVRRDEEDRGIAEYEGKHLAPARIRTRAGPIRLLANPDMSVDLEHFGEGEARSWIERTEFQSLGGGKSALVEGLRSELQLGTDPDGRVSKDLHYRDAGDGPLTIHQQVLLDGAHVAVKGLYDPAQRAFVPGKEPLKLRVGTAASWRPTWLGIVLTTSIGLAVAAGSTYGMLLPTRPAAELKQLGAFGEWILELRKDPISPSVSRARRRTGRLLVLREAIRASAALEPRKRPYRSRWPGFESRPL